MATSQHGHPGRNSGRGPVPGGVSRRRFLAGAAGAGALAISAGGITAPAALASAGQGQPQGLPSLPEVWGWEQQLVQFGTRYTGLPSRLRAAHARRPRLPGGVGGRRHRR